MENTVAHVWQDFFANWPPSFRRKGVVNPGYDEQIPFNDFVIGDGVVVLERPTPDGVGARRVAIPFARIAAVKYTEPLKTQQFLEAGFKGASTKNQPAKKQPVAATAG